MTLFTHETESEKLCLKQTAELGSPAETPGMQVVMNSVHSAVNAVLYSVGLHRRSLEQTLFIAANTHAHVIMSPTEFG